MTATLQEANPLLPFAFVAYALAFKSVGSPLYENVDRGHHFHRAPIPLRTELSQFAVAFLPHVSPSHSTDFCGFGSLVSRLEITVEIHVALDVQKCANVDGLLCRFHSIPLIEKLLEFEKRRATETNPRKPRDI